MKFEKITPGMVLWDVHSQRMGSTTAKSIGTWAVRIVEVDANRRRALASWNGNAATWMFESQLSKLKAEKPVLIRTGMGGWRRPTREELKEIRAKAKASA